MGLALFAESRILELAPETAPSSAGSETPVAELDAFAKGKGKGKGKGDGRCHTCNGEGHFARVCPWVPPVSPQAVKCLGCNGRGHYKRDCLTASPHMKNKGGKEAKDGDKDRQRGEGKAAKAKDRKNGKGNNGKGKGGKGIYQFDLMGSDPWGGEGSWGKEQA